MDASDLRIFEAVARTGGMSRAAAELHTVQSNVTNRIRLLEEELGTKLFDRQSRGVVMTAAGQRLLPFAYRIRDEIEDARRAASDDGAPRGPMAIGSLETTAALRLSPILADYMAACPQVDMVLRTGTTCELVQAVLERRLEGAFVCGPVNHPHLVEDPVFREELAILSPPSPHGLDDVLGQSDVRIVVLRTGCSYRQRLEDILARRGVVGLRILEFGMLEAVFGCVAAGFGITLLPVGLIGPVWQQGRTAIHTLPAEDATVETVFIRRRNAFASSAIKAFLNHVHSAAFISKAAE